MLKRNLKKQEPIIWDKENGELDDFFEISRMIGLTHIIYVIDADGELNSVWATSTEDLIECLYTFSNKCYFGRVQNIENAIQYGFFDDVINN